MVFKTNSYLQPKIMEIIRSIDNYRTSLLSSLSSLPITQDRGCKKVLQIVNLLLIFLSEQELLDQDFACAFFKMVCKTKSRC